jgi:hypothetical protein
MIVGASFTAGTDQLIVDLSSAGVVVPAGARLTCGFGSIEASVCTQSAGIFTITAPLSPTLVQGSI